MLKQISGKKPIAIIITCVVLMVGCGNSQNTTAFQYKGHPVHPLLIRELLPNPESGKSIGCIGLDHQKKFDNIETVFDSSTVNHGTWYLTHYSNTGFTDYHLVSVYKDYFCIIIRDVDGSFPMAYVCFIYLESNKICMAGFIEIPNLRDNLVAISGDDLYIGKSKHSIKSIIPKH